MPHHSKDAYVKSYATQNYLAYKMDKSSLTCNILSNPKTCWRIIPWRQPHQKEGCVGQKHLFLEWVYILIYFNRFNFAIAWIIFIHLAWFILKSFNRVYFDMLWISLEQAAMELATMFFFTLVHFHKVSISSDHAAMLVAMEQWFYYHGSFS